MIIITYNFILRMCYIPALGCNVVKFSLYSLLILFCLWVMAGDSTLNVEEFLYWFGNYTLYWPLKEMGIWFKEADAFYMAIWEEQYIVIQVKTGRLFGVCFCQYTITSTCIFRCSLGHTVVQPSLNSVFRFQLWLTAGNGHRTIYRRDPMLGSIVWWKSNSLQIVVWF